MTAKDREAPVVSVLVPAFNCAATLRECVQSALAQSFTDFEIIIIDDGSLDDTAAVARELAAQDRRMKVLNRTNGGVSAALNAGLGRARGDYVARLDSDDFWHPAKLEKQILVAQANPDAAFIYTFVRYVDSAGNILSDGPRQHFAKRALNRGAVESLIGANSSALMKRSVALELGGYDEGLASCEDLFLQLRISARHEIACVPEFLVGYRVRHDSLSQDPDTALRSWRAARRKIERAFPQISGEARRWANARRCMDCAEAFAWRGRWVKTVALLIEAIINDPQWSIRYLAHRISRRLRSARDEGPRPGRRHFRDCDPDAPSLQGETGSRNVLAAFEKRRLERIVALDRAQEGGTDR